MLIFRTTMNDKELKQQRYDEAYMRMATEWAQLSHCTRKQVGALICLLYTSDAADE